MAKQNVRFTMAYDADVLREIKGNKSPNIKYLAAAMLYNTVRCLSDPDVNDGWIRLSKAWWEKRTGLSGKTMIQATQSLQARGMIEHKLGALTEEEKAKWGDGNLFRPHKPSFGAVNEVDDVNV